jgi:hypothetical protein
VSKSTVNSSRHLDTKMQPEQLKLLLKKMRFQQDSFQQHLLELLEPHGEKYDVYSNLFATSTSLRRLAMRALEQLEENYPSPTPLTQLDKFLMQVGEMSPEDIENLLNKLTIRK